MKTETTNDPSFTKVKHLLNKIHTDEKTEFSNPAEVVNFILLHGWETSQDKANIIRKPQEQTD